MSAGAETAADTYAGLSCPHCGTPRDARTVRSGVQRCPVCSRSFEAVRFEPPPPDVSVPRLAEAGPEGGHACPQHPANASLASCSRCGVFICALCRIEAEARVLCPACFERLCDDGALPGLVAGYRDYARVQVSLVVLGLLLPFLAPIAGPAAVYYGVKALEQMETIGRPDGRSAVYVASVIGGLEAVGGLALAAWLVVR